MTERASSTVAPQTVARVAGLATLVAFFGISASRFGFYVSFHPPFTRIDQGEATLWLAASLLLTPAGLLLGFGYSPSLVKAVSWVSARLGGLTLREKRLGLLGLGLTALAIARLCNQFVLLGYPVTDDEWGARFGGQMLARGKSTPSGASAAR